MSDVFLRMHVVVCLFCARAGAFATLTRRVAHTCPLLIANGLPPHTDTLCRQRRRAMRYGSGTMRGALKRLAIALCAILAGMPASLAADDDWTVLTMARDGSWGVGCHGLQWRA